MAIRHCVLMIFGVLANDSWSVYDFPGFMDPSSHCSICRQRRHSEIFDIQRSSVELGQSKWMHPSALRSFQRQIWGKFYGSTALADIHGITHGCFVFCSKVSCFLLAWHVGHSSGMCLRSVKPVMEWSALFQNLKENSDISLHKQTKAMEFLHLLESPD